VTGQFIDKSFQSFSCTGTELQVDWDRQVTQAQQVRQDSEVGQVTQA